MLSNLHTHTTFCDGKNTPEENVISALEQGFSTLGFSAHSTTPFDLSYCIQDENGYIAEITRLKEKYKNSIDIYLGIEEDMYTTVNRNKFDFLIGSAHYVKKENRYFPVDETYENTKKLVEYFDNDSIKVAEYYYSSFCDYILKRKPDIIGHFDLITKFDEKYEPFFLGNKEYESVAEKFIKKAILSGSIFEVNTGAISRKIRTSPYPYENLLHILQKETAPITLSSDSHNKDNLAFYFDECKKMLYDVGFRYIYVFSKGEFIKERIF